MLTVPEAEKYTTKAPADAVPGGGPFFIDGTSCYILTQQKGKTGAISFIYFYFSFLRWSFTLVAPGWSAVV